MQSILLRIYFISFIIKNKKLIKIIEQIKDIILQKIVKISFNTFPEKKLIKHYEFANKYLGEVLTDKKDMYETNNEYIRLKNILEKDDFINKYFSKMYLLKAYLLQSFPSLLSDKYKNIEKKFMKKSIEFDDKATKLDKKTYKELVHKIEIDKKSLASEMKSIGAKTISKKRKNYIEPINISIQSITIILSLMSTAFIIGGYIYTSILLSYYGVDVSHFYSIIDYLSSSVSIIPTILLTTFLGIVFFFIGVFDTMNNQIISDEFNIKQENNILPPDYIISISILIVVVLIANFYIYNKIIYDAVQVLGLMLLLIIIRKINISEFIKNANTVVLTLLISYIFFSSVILKSYNKINLIDSGKYTSNYSITFTPEYNKFKDMQFITMNSNYLFLYDEDKGEIIIIPSESIKVIKAINR